MKKKNKYLNCTLFKFSKFISTSIGKGNFHIEYIEKFHLIDQLFVGQYFKKTFNIL